MLRLPTLAPRRLLTLSLTLAAALATLGLTGPARADYGSPTLGVITAQTFVDPITHVGPAAGNGTTDDYAALQDMISYALYHNEAVLFEPGKYRITKTLMIALNTASSQVSGFRIAGLAGPNPYGMGQGVCIFLDANSTTQPAVLEVGQGAFYNMTIENLGLTSNVPNFTTPYGLYFAEQEFSHVKVHMVDVENVGTDYAVVAGVTKGGNGEALTLENCCGGGKCFYFNNCGQAYYHRILNCQGGALNGGVFLKIGNPNGAHDLDVSSISCTFGTGPLRNTFLEVAGVSGTINVKGGRVESCDTILSYWNGGPGGGSGIVTVEGLDFDQMQGLFPILDASHYGIPNVPGDPQYTNKILRCKIGCASAKPLTVAPMAGEDLSRNYFDQCVFCGGWTTRITDISNQPALNAMQVRVRDCRTGIPGDSLLDDLHDYTPTPPARGGY